MGRIIIFHNSWLILPQCLFRSFQLYCPPDFSFSKTNDGPNVNIMFSNVNSMNDSSRFNYLELSTADLNSELNLALDSVVTTPTPPPTTGKTSTLRGDMRNSKSEITRQFTQKQESGLVCSDSSEYQFCSDYATGNSVSTLRLL